MKINHNKLLLTATLCLSALLVWREVQRPTPAALRKSTSAAGGPSTPAFQSGQAVPAVGAPEVESRKSVTVEQMRIDNNFGAGLEEWGLSNSNVRFRSPQLRGPEAGGENIGTQSRPTDLSQPAEIHINLPGQRYPVDIGLEDAAGGAYPGVGTLGQPSRHLLDMRGNAGMGGSFSGK